MIKVSFHTPDFYQLSDFFENFDIFLIRGHA